MKNFREIADYAGVHGLPVTYKHYSITSEQYATALKKHLDTIVGKKRSNSKKCGKCQRVKPLNYYNTDMRKAECKKSVCKVCENL